MKIWDTVIGQVDFMAKLDRLFTQFECTGEWFKHIGIKAGPGMGKSLILDAIEERVHNYVSRIAVPPKFNLDLYMEELYCDWTSDGGFVAMDEFHNIGKNQEGFKNLLTSSIYVNRNGESLSFPNFKLIVASNRFDMLDDATQRRFFIPTISYPYSLENLCDIAESLGVDDISECVSLAKQSNGSPSILVDLVNSRSLAPKDLEWFSERDENGITLSQKQYALALLSSKGKASSERLSMVLCRPYSDWKTDEQALILRGYIRVAQGSGRRFTIPDGFEWAKSLKETTIK